MSARRWFTRSLGLALLWAWASAWTWTCASSAFAQTAASACVDAHAEAQVLRNRGALLKAHARLLSCAQNHCPKPVADDCASWLGAVEDSISSVVFAVSDERGRDLVDVEVVANGEKLADKTDGRAVQLDPGAYSLRFSAEGYVPAQASVSVRQSEKNRIVRVQLQRAVDPAAHLDTAVDAAPAAATAAPPTHSAHPVPALTYVLGATTIVGAGMYAYFGLSGLSKERELSRLPPEQPCGSLCSEGKRDYILADIGLGIAIGSAAGAVLAYLLAAPDADREAPKHAQISLSPLIANSAAGMHCSATF